MEMEHEIPKKLGVLATHGDGEPPKTLDACYVKEIMYYFNNPEKTPFNFVMGDTLDCYVLSLRWFSPKRKG